MAIMVSVMSSKLPDCPEAARIIEAIGGPAEFARWWWGSDFSKAHAQIAWRWRKRGFPRELFLLMSGRLWDEKRIEATPAAWNLQDFQQAAE
jgi:hypothetical protein